MTPPPGPDESLSRLWSAFVDPPDAARPRAWWHWMDGNVDPAGIERDLEWLHRVGVRGVQLFDGGMGVPLVVPEAVRPGTPEWRAAVSTAARTAERLGLELAVATSSGWSAAGGPWVRPSDAMKKVVWSETVVDGGDRVEIALPPLPDVAGLYQDTPREGGAASERFAVDWRVLAIPHAHSADALRPDAVTSSGAIEDAALLVDGSFATAFALPRDPDGWSDAWVEQQFSQPATVRSVVVGLPGPRGFGAAPAASAVLRVSDDGVEYRDVVALDPTTVPARTASFAPVTGRRFRLLLSGGSAADALPPLSPGVRVPPVLRPTAEFLLTQFALHGAGRVHHAEVKAGLGAAFDYYAIDSPLNSAEGAAPPESVIDVGAFVENGVLSWDAPPGRWLVLRLGASLTGQTNGPAPADSTGLEVDKLDGARVAAYLDAHLARFAGTAPEGAPGFAALLSDSIEAGPQNWTDDIADEFASRRGYDPTPWLPTLTGRLVGSPSESDRFLYDYRRTLAEVLASEYYGTLGAEARRRGMTYYAEALEDGRPSLGDDLAMRAAADVPMGAMWTFAPERGPRPTYVADLKGAASVAHVYGKEWTGSEAFTSFDEPWSWTPRSLKHIADLQLSLGVTRFCLHTSPHQPLAAPPPGIALAPFLGQAFTVHETWSGMASPWIDYLARCCAVLSAGRPSVEVAVFVGEERPVTALPADDVLRLAADGIDADFVGIDGLLRVLRVEQGELVSEGATYALLHLGGSSHRMTLAALEAVERLVDDGARVVGSRPATSPSLADDPAEFEAACDRLWGTGRVSDVDLDEALAGFGIRSPLRIEGGPVRRISRIVDGARVTFVANPTPEALRLRVTALDGRRLAAWDPVAVTRAPLPTERSTPDGPVAHTVELAPFGSLFLVADEADMSAPTSVRTPAEVELRGDWIASLPGLEPLTMRPGPTLWTDADSTARGFSGVGTYRHEFRMPEHEKTHASWSLELDVVRDIARVVLNGQDCGVAWTAPFRVDVSSALRPGLNTLEVHVATPWRNRLIAEAAHASGELFAPATTVFTPTAEPLPAGLSGRVRLVSEA
ncbi:glycosyl hydrolase [Microbacterium sp. NPDC057407]|uniref:glycosyl hydrolase n=1 Tax=Microbacterium sp. NPDC057407 TaxID=3346120 RepID=UPI00366F0D4B